MKLYEHTYYVAEKLVDGRWKRQVIEDETAEQVAAQITRVVGSAESEWRVVGVTETESVVLNLPNTTATTHEEYDALRLQQNVNEDAQALVDALLRGERADAYCGYGRDGQASNYRDELKRSLRELQKSNTGLSQRITNAAHGPCRDRRLVLLRFMISKIRKTVFALIERDQNPPLTRVRDKFLLRPRRLGSRWYWLERVKWEEEYTEGYSCTGYDYTPAGYYFKRLIRDQATNAARKL